MTAYNSDDHVLSILYVEDDQDSREGLSEIIRSRYPDVRLLVAENGGVGLELFKLNQPEIIISDINMPVTNGIIMATKIRAISPTAEIIFLTAYTDIQYLMQAIEIGISHFILKPINVAHVLEILDKKIATILSERLIAQKNDEILQLNKFLAKKTEELELANKELEAFDYTLAHDLRSPMVTISGFSQVLIDMHASTLDDKSKSCLKLINSEVIRLSSYIGAMLNFSLYSRKHVEKKWTDLTGIAHEIRAGLQVQETGRHVTFCIADGIKGYCEPDLLRIVLENLIGNAWKYSAKVVEARIEFGAINMEEDLVYFVRDNGEGFDQTESHKLFTPFQRLQNDAEAEGFGIGLATVYRIIQRHGGRIWGEGEKGKGATFYFCL